MLAFAFIITGVAAIAITSCRKNNNAAVTSTSQSSKMDASVDLNEYVTTFTDNEDGSRTITFSEPDDVVFADVFLEQLQLKSATIPAGIYTINVSPSGKSTLDLPFKNAVGLQEHLGGNTDPVPMGLYLSKREAKCRDNNFKSRCICGLGVRCNFQFAESTPYLEETMCSVIVTGGNPTGIHIEFNENSINWEQISSGF